MLFPACVKCRKTRDLAVKRLTIGAICFIISKYEISKGRVAEDRQNRYGLKRTSVLGWCQTTLFSCI